MCRKKCGVRITEFVTVSATVLVFGRQVTDIQRS